MFRVFLMAFLIQLSAFASPPEVLVRSTGMSEEQYSLLRESVLQYPKVQEALRNKTYRVMSFEVDDEDKRESQYTLNIYNYTDDQMLEVTGPMLRSVSPQIRETQNDLPSTLEEYEDAVKIVSEDSTFGPALAAGDLQTYEPMPSTGSMSLRGRSARPTRVIHVGVNSSTDPDKNEIVGVDLLTRKVIRFPNRAPESAIATRVVCGFPSAGQANTARGTRGSAAIEINRGGSNLWKFTVVRPSASSGSKGSGLEIRDVYYKGKKVFSRAHTPILNVQYAGNRCGPFRDWAYSENPFNAVGTDKAPGIRIASARPTTILETHQDRGNFRGVAIYSTEDRVTLTTELAAGWYRYVSRFELYNDGTIKPIFQFSAVQNSCVCYSHNHHVYWRLDFDADGEKNFAYVSNGSAFRPVSTEASFLRNLNNRRWRIMNPPDSLGYDVIPGAGDGTADSYGVADAWLLRYSSRQYDDSSVRTSTRAALNAFVNGESLVNQDLVFWYAGHFLHDQGGAEASQGRVGPTLSPVGSW